MRIGVDARLFYYQPAGIGLYTRRLLTAMAGLDTANDYVVLQNRRDRLPLVSAPNFVRRGLWTPPHHRLEQWTLPLELTFLELGMGMGLDLLHSPDFIPPLRWRGRSVITVMDLAFLRFPHLLTDESRRYYSQVTKAIARADAILAISDSTRRDLVGLLSARPEKITVTYLAADPAYQPVVDSARLARVREAYGLSAETILFVGTLEPRKDLPTLLRAFARARRSRPGLRLAVAGRQGWLCEPVFDLVRELQLGEAVRFLGPVPADDLPALYSLATLFVLPSLYEGFGMPVLEAMACGTPVVCTDVSSLPEIVGDAALLVPVGDPQALADAMERCLNDDDLRAEMSRRGLRQAARFSWAETARKTLGVYTSLA